MSATATFVHPMPTMHGQQSSPFSRLHPSSFSHSNPPTHAASRHLHAHSQSQFLTPPQVQPPLQQQLSSSPFGGRPAGPSSMPPPPPAPASFHHHHHHHHRSQQHSQVPPSSHQPVPQPPPPAYAAFSHPVYGPPPLPPEYNKLEMNREMVMRVLDKFSEELPNYFDLEGADDASRSGSGSSGDERTRRRRRDGDPSTSARSKPQSIRLTVHGGACMLLHQGFHALSLEMSEFPQPKPSASSSRHSPPDASRRHSDPTYVGPRPTTMMHDLARRTSTRDIDVLLRGFVADYANLGPPPSKTRRRRLEEGWAEPEEDISRIDAATRLKACIKATARHFPGLGLDWMNADADVSLPMAADPATLQTYDPIHTSTWTQKNTHLYTVYTSPNKRLVLSSVPPYWLLALKLSRWGPRDWVDVGIVLRYGTLISRSLFRQDIEWTGESLKRFLEKECWPMGYAGYDVGKKGVFMSRCEHAAALVKGWEEGVPDGWPGRFLDRSLLEGAADWSGENQDQIGIGMNASLPTPPAAPPPAVPYQEYRENVRDWARKSRSRRRTSSSRRRSRSKSRWRRKEEEEEERLRRDGPFVPPGVDFDPEGYVVDVSREEQEERRGRARSQWREHPQQQTYGDPYAGHAHPHRLQHAQPRHLTGNDNEPTHSSWISASMARARISSPIQDVNHAGPVDPSLASMAWHPRARAVAAGGGDHSSAVSVMDPSTGMGIYGSSSPYHRSSPYNSHHQPSLPGANRPDRDRQRSMKQPGTSSNYDHDRDRGRGPTLRREHAAPESDEESESDGSEEEEESGEDSDGQNVGSESDDSESDKENRGRGYPPQQRHSRPGRGRMHLIYAPPTPHPAATAPPISRAGSSQSGIDGSLLLQPPSSTHLPPGIISGRNVQRSPSPHPPKRRPPPLDIAPPLPPPEVLPGPSPENGGKASRNTYSSSSTNVHPAYFGGAYGDDHQRQLEPPYGHNQHRSQSRRPSPNPPNPSHPHNSSHHARSQAQAPTPLPLPAHRIHARQPLAEAQPEPQPPLPREARAAQYQFEQQMRDWEQQQRQERDRKNVMGRTTGRDFTV